MNDWVGHADWHAADGLPPRSPVNCTSWRRPEKVRRSKTNFLPTVLPTRWFLRTVNSGKNKNRQWTVLVTPSSRKCVFQLERAHTTDYWLGIVKIVSIVRWWCCRKLVKIRPPTFAPSPPSASRGSQVPALWGAGRLSHRRLHRHLCST